MSIYQLKTKFQNVLRPISNVLVKHGFTANQVTISAVALSSITAYLIACQTKQNQKIWYVLPVSLFIRMAMNAIDGMMAKEHGQASRLGAVLNEIGDLISDTVLIASLKPHVVDSCNKDFITFEVHNNIVIGLSLTTEAIAIISEQLHGQRANHGPLGKSDRAFVLGLLGLLAGANVLAQSSQHNSCKIHMMYITTELLLLKTMSNRIQYMRSASNS